MAAPAPHVWKHAVETVLLLEAAAAAAVTILPGLGTPGWAVPAIEAIVAVIASFVIWATTSSGRFTTYPLAFGTFLVLWTVRAEQISPWHAVIIVAWIAGIVVFGPLGAVWFAPKAPPAQQAVREDPDAAQREEIAKWDFLFESVGIPGVRVTELREERAGRVLRLALPRDGSATIDSLNAVADKVAVILHLRPGTVEFEHGDHSADIIMRLRERNVLAKVTQFSPEHRVSTVNKPFAVGVQEDGSIAKITLRELHAMIVGTTGAGKSNLINVMLAQLTGCVDTLIWVIDMKGGRVVKPWLQPWGEGLTEAPALDWVATTREEAALMMAAFNQAIQARANSGIGGSKIVPSASMPQIVLITDEMADLFGVTRGTRSQVGEDGTTNSVFISLAESAAQKGRSEACATVWATQRGTVTMTGSGDLKSLCTLRISLGSATAADAYSVTPDSRIAQKRAAGLLSVKGGGVIVRGEKVSLPTKFFWLDHPLIPGTETDETQCAIKCVPHCAVHRAAIECGPVRPRMDRITADALGEVYASRWVRAGSVVRLPARVAAVREAADEVDATQFDEIVAGLDEEKVHPARQRIRDYLGLRGVEGASPALILADLERQGHTITRETVQRWLRDDEGREIVHRASFGRWKIGKKPDENAA